MPKQERGKKSTPAGRTGSFRAAVKTVKPTIKLDATALKRFNALIRSRELDTWTAADIDLATKAAQISVELDRLWEQYRNEGPTVTSERGYVVKNPLLTAYEGLSNQYKAYRSSLGLNASQRGISGHKQKGRNLQETKARKTLASVSSLISKPSG